MMHKPHYQVMHLPFTLNKCFTLSKWQNEHSTLPTPLFNCISNPACSGLEREQPYQMSLKYFTYQDTCPEYFF